MHEWFTRAQALDRWSFSVTMQICALMQNLERELNGLSCELEALWFIRINILYKTVWNVAFASIISSLNTVEVSAKIQFPPRNTKTSRCLFRHCQIACVIQIFHVQEYEIFVDVWLHASTFSSETKIYLFRFYFSFFLYSVYFFKSKVIPFGGNIAVDAWLGGQLTLINWLIYSFTFFSKYSRNTFACCSRCKAIK